jgi:hypothetical protein
MTYCAYRLSGEPNGERCGVPAIGAVELPIPARVLKRYPVNPVEVTPDDHRCGEHKVLLQDGGEGYFIEFPFDPSPPRARLLGSSDSSAQFTGGKLMQLPIFSRFKG